VSCCGFSGAGGDSADDDDGGDDGDDDCVDGSGPSTGIL
jgi:hypothetical protein